MSDREALARLAETEHLNLDYPHNHHDVDEYIHKEPISKVLFLAFFVTLILIGFAGICQ